ncbi:MAG: glycosyltransferase family 4 protein [Dehalococcoidia bacterium]|nr:glycosyltransferase family 4 protein [Dehalococcoidia bacterium]
MTARTLRVFLNASSLPARPAGAGVYALELAGALAAHAGVEVAVAAPRPITGVEQVPVPGGGPARRFAWELGGLGAAVERADANVYHGTHFYTPRRLGVPRVTTIHDLTFFRLPKRYGFAHREYYRGVARTARWAERIIVPSRAVATDAVRYLGLAPQRIRVIPEAPRPELRPAPAEAVAELRARLGLEQPYLLCLGTAEPGKRAVDAIRALPSVRESHPSVVLALAGNPGRLSKALASEAARLGVADAVKFPGYVPDDDLAALFTGAEALVFPSLFEGFGLPPLEAMACGTPVIAAQAPAMDDVLAGAAIFVPLRDPGAIASAASELVGDPARRADVSKMSLQLAATYSWKRVAEETVAVYRELVR